jgi:uncharacterized protein (DUF1501 family)
MDRKFFVTNALPVSIISSLAIMGALKHYRTSNVFQSPKRTGYEDRVLVLIQLNGGNDGLNTVIPLDQYTNLTNARKNILIPDNKVLAINGSAVTGLHPAMTDLQKLYNQKQVSIIQGVGYANPDLSHFRSIDIWNTGSDSSTTLDTGWLGRFLDREYHDFYKTNQPDPPAIQIGAALSKVLQGTESNMGMSVREVDHFYDLLPPRYDPSGSVHTRGQLSFIRRTVTESKGYFIKINAAARAQQNLSKMYPSHGSNQLADQLKLAARLIGGGLETKVYMVSLGGFDTHGKQVDTSDTTKGIHAGLLSKLSEAIAAFQDDLSLMGKQDKVLGMTISVSILIKHFQLIIFLFFEIL